MRYLNIFQGMVTAIAAYIVLTDILEPNKYSPFYIYSQNDIIISLGYIYVITNAIFALYYLHIYRLLYLKFLYNSNWAIISINILFIISNLILLLVEVFSRSSLPYYGEVSDKHNDFGIVHLSIAPVIIIVRSFIKMRWRKNTHRLAKQYFLLKILIQEMFILESFRLLHQERLLNSSEKFI